ncbi:MAG: hypothetical protein HOH32_13165, partial [Rhodobacteraceae bacterium]|nr:hypothetical protein [Paracoccaceae bacterium]
QRALNLVRERIGAREAELFQAGVVDPEWDVTDDFRELAIELKGSVPDEVFRQIGNALIVPETFSLNKVLEEYYATLAQSAAKVSLEPNLTDAATRTNVSFKKER